MCPVGFFCFPGLPYILYESAADCVSRRHLIRHDGMVQLSSYLDMLVLLCPSYADHRHDGVVSVMINLGHDP